MIFITLNYIHCFLMIFIHGCGMWVWHVPDLSFQKLATMSMAYQKQKERSKSAKQLLRYGRLNLAGGDPGKVSVLESWKLL